LFMNTLKCQLTRRYAHAQHVGVDPKPFAMNRGLIKISLTAIGSMYVGGKIAQKAATFLEENEIFVHSEDEDDE